MRNKNKNKTLEEIYRIN